MSKISLASSESDWNRIRDICCLTGSAGQAIEPDRWEFFGELWIAPYQKYCAPWAWLARSVSDPALAVGYLTGCPDTTRFRLWQRRRHFNRLLFELLTRRRGWSIDARRFMRREIGLDRWPEERFSKGFRRSLERDYPAHLHMNLLPEARGQQLGRALVETYSLKLRTIGTRGVHLFCGPGPVPFYQKLGFRELEWIEFGHGIRVCAMGFKL